MPDLTSSAVVADTIVRTLELGVTITDAALDAVPNVGTVAVINISWAGQRERPCSHTEARL